MDLSEFKQKIPAKKAIMGFDYGSKRLGVAVSDLSHMIATAQKIIYRQNKKADMNEVLKIIEEKEVGALVFGLPLQMNGQEGDVAAEVREFAEALGQRTNLPYTFWDERMSSSAVESFFIKEVDMSRGKRKKVLDSTAACYILQGFLDALSLK